MIKIKKILKKYILVNSNNNISNKINNYKINSYNIKNINNLNKTMMSFLEDIHLIHKWIIKEQILSIY